MPAAGNVLGVSQDGGYVVSAADDGTVRVLNTGTRRDTAVGEPQPGGVERAAISPTGDTAVVTSGERTDSTDDDRTRWLRLDTGDPIAEAYERYESVVFSPDGQTVAGLRGPMVRIWRAPSGAVVDVRVADTSSDIDSMEFTPDGSTLVLVVVVVDRADVMDPRAELRLLRTRNGTEWHRAPIAYNRSEFTGRLADQPALVNRSVVAVATGEGVLAGRDTDGRIRILDYHLQRVRRTCIGHSGPVRRIVISPDGRILATSGSDGTVRLWPTVA
jgi:WD40 repeat protein